MLKANAKKVVVTGHKTKKKGFWINTWENKALVFMALPVVVLLILFNYVPMCGSLVAFKRYSYADGIWKSPWIGFENFKFLFNMKELTWRLLRNTVGYFLLFTVVGLVCNLALALALNECRGKKFSKISQTLMIMPTFISYVAVNYIVNAFVDSNGGILNNLLASWGLETVNWYNEAKYWPFILLIVKIWKDTGYGCIIYLSALAGMDQELFEAAQLDGATKWQQIWRITLPLLAPMICIMQLMNVANILTSNTGLFYQVTRNSSMLYETTQTIDTYVLNALSSGANFGPTAAVSLFQQVVGCVLCISSNFIVRKIDPDSALF